MGVDPPTPPTPPTDKKRKEPPQKCTLCNAAALKKPEPDGVPRCFGHSIDPLNQARLKANAERGRAEGEKQRGVSPEQRGAVLAGVVPIDQARAAAIASKAKQQAKQTTDEAAPIELDSRERVLGFLARAAGRLLASGEGDAKEAQAAAALARAALAAMGVEEQGEGEGEVAGFDVIEVGKKSASA